MPRIKDIRSKIIFSYHNLISDNPFGEMNLLLCRNVLIYFNANLRESVIKLFYKSLDKDGIFCLGAKESLYLSELENHFKELVREEKIYQKKNMIEAEHRNCCYTIDNMVCGECEI